MKMSVDACVFLRDARALVLTYECHLRDGHQLLLLAYAGMGGSEDNAPSRIRRAQLLAEYQIALPDDVSLELAQEAEPSGDTGLCEAAMEVGSTASDACAVSGCPAGMSAASHGASQISPEGLRAAGEEAGTRSHVQDEEVEKAKFMASWRESCPQVCVCARALMLACEKTVSCTAVLAQINDMSCQSELYAICLCLCVRLALCAVHHDSDSMFDYRCLIASNRML